MQDPGTAEAVLLSFYFISHIVWSYKWSIFDPGFCDFIFFLISGKFGDLWLISGVKPIVVIQKYFPVLPWIDPIPLINNGFEESRIRATCLWCTLWFDVWSCCSICETEPLLTRLRRFRLLFWSYWCVCPVPAGNRALQSPKETFPGHWVICLWNSGSGQSPPGSGFH